MGRPEQSARTPPQNAAISKYIRIIEKKRKEKKKIYPAIMIRMKRYTGLASGPVALFDSLSEPVKKRKEMRHWGAHRSRSVIQY